MSLQIRTTDGPMHAIASLQVVATTGGPERSFLGDGAAARWQWLAGSEGEYTAGLPVYHGRQAGTRSRAAEIERPCYSIRRVLDSSSLPFFRFGDEQQKAEGISV